MQSRDLPRLIPAHAGKTSGRPSPAALGRAHPRSRGENEGGHVDVDAGRGSSPLTRGKPARLPDTSPGSGLIPAHAGKTPRRRLLRVNLRAHPRSRGENLAWAVNGARSYGSSPLTRGKRKTLYWSPAGQRLIPAHAGKTRAGRNRPRRRWAHPRSRGENLVPAGRMVIGGGSSPLTRGKHWWLTLPRWRVRLIPAHAGKTAW